MGFLRRVFWGRGQPSLSLGLFSVVWTLRHAIDVSPGGVNGPIQLATLTLDANGTPRAEMLDEEEIEAHEAASEEAEADLARFEDTLEGGDEPAPPEPPPSP
jgi:hypothetical protein